MPTIRRLLYLSLVDVSIPYGPGVNERGFIRDLATRFGDRFRAVVPRPLRGVPDDLAGIDIRFLTHAANSRAAAGWLEARSAGCARAVRAVREFEPDFIVLRLGALPTPQLAAVHRSDVPYGIKTAAPATLQRINRFPPARRAIAGLNRRLHRQLLAGSAVVDVGSRRYLEQLVEADPSLRYRIHEIDNGVDLELFAPAAVSTVRERMALSDEHILIGYVGNYPMRRGGKEVVDLVEALSPALPVRGVIVGDGGEAGMCRAYAEERGVAALVAIAGEVPFEEVPGLMAAMDLGLSILRPEERGASEQKVRQYLAAGTCVIGTAGTNDFLEGRGFARVIQTVNVEEIVEAARGLAADGRRGLQARARVAREFAAANLSLAERNERRIRLWESAVALRRVMRTGATG